MGFPEKLNEIKLLRSLTNSMIGEMAGTSESAVRSWLTGAKSPSIDNFARLCESLEVKADYLLDFSDNQVVQFFSAEEKELLAVYQELAISGKRQLLGKAYELLDSQQSR